MCSGASKRGCAGVNQIWKRKKKRLPQALSWAITFAFVNVTFVFFRSPNLPFAFHFLRQMLPHANLFGVSALAGVVPLATELSLAANHRRLAFWRSSERPLLSWRSLTYLLRRRHLQRPYCLAIAVVYMNTAAAKTFLYFAF